MKYALLIYDDQAVADVDPDTLREVYGRYSAGLAESGLIRGGEQLSYTSATTVRFDNGKMSMIDSPFAETEEQLGGFYLIECNSLDEALKAASHESSRSTFPATQPLGDKRRPPRPV